MGADLDKQFRIAARYVDQILRGANLEDLPIRHPSRYCLTVNANAAQNSLVGPAVTSPRATGSGLALMPALADARAAAQAPKAKRPHLQKGGGPTTSAPWR